MNWDDLRVFLAVARSPTLAEASRALGIDPTTVGRRLARLANAFDATLIEPGPAGQILTAYGRKLLAYAETVEKAATSAKGDLAGERGLLAGTIRVSVSEGFGTWVIARHLRTFHEANPAIRVELVATNGFLSPSKREADLAIMLAQPSGGPLRVRKLTEYRLKLYAAAAYIEQHGAPKTIADLKRHALIGYIPDFIYADELRYLDEIGKDLEPALVSSSINVQHSLTAASSGIGVLPCFIGDEDHRLVRVLDDRTIARSFWLVVHKDVRRLDRVDAFIEWLNALVQSLQPVVLGERR